MIKTVKGLVLRSIRYGESDKLITILTEEGMIFFKARGIRSITSKNAAGCAAFVYSEFILEQRGDKSYLRKALPLYSTIRAGASLQALALASYFAELCEDTARDAETGKAVLRLLMNALFLLSKEDRPCEVIKSVFEIRLLAANGLMPHIEECAVCEKTAEECPTLYFRLIDGDLICSDCKIDSDQALLRVSKEMIALCRHSLESTEEKAYAVRIPEALQKEFSRFTERFLLHQLEHNYKTLDFYKQVAVPEEHCNGEKNESI